MSLNAEQAVPVVEPRPIHLIAEALEIAADEIESCGTHAAKLRLELLDRCAERSQGKLILVTAITPTSHGEGKTVVSIGLAQGLHLLGHKTIVTLRQPSLGPIFGVKGGATGGGKSQVIPQELINLHFTGDFHAVAAAHNLLAAIIDSHIYHGNELEIDASSIFWPRAIDVDDRALRHVTLGQAGGANGVPRETTFVITAASEIMAILALAESRADLRRRLDEIVIGLNRKGGPVRAKDLRCTGAMMVLLNKAILPNLVQTNEHTPALVHAGPFANIAHGTSSVIAQKMALGLSEYVVNETGFGADLGAEKYFDIVMPASGLRPAVAVLVVSVRALAAQATQNDPRGFDNLKRHLQNLEKFDVPVVVALNRFEYDAAADIDAVHSFCTDVGVAFAVTDAYFQGGKGALDLAAEVIRTATGKPRDVHPLYSPNLSLPSKIEAIAKEIYGAQRVRFDSGVTRHLEMFAALGYGEFPVCIAKTQSSFTDAPKAAGAPSDWVLTITDAHLAAGAGFIVAVAGHMLLMPGLGKDPQAIHMNVDDDGTIHGLH